MTPDRFFCTHRLGILGIRDLEAHIKFEVVFSPISWRKRYNLTKGSTHGLSHTLPQLGYMRPLNQHPRFHNLYFVGASTRPGTGVPTALIGARQVATRVEVELRRLPVTAIGAAAPVLHSAGAQEAN